MDGAELLILAVPDGYTSLRARIDAYDEGTGTVDHCLLYLYLSQSVLLNVALWLTHLAKLF